MRRSLVKLLALAGAAIGIGSSILFSRITAPKTAGAIDKDVQRLLTQVLIPQLELHEATLPEAVAVLNRALARSPEAAHFRIAVWAQPDPPPGFLRKPAAPPARRDVIPGLISEPGNRTDLNVSTFPADDPDPRITITLKDVPLVIAARYIGGLGDCGLLSYRKANTLYFVKGCLGPFVERTVTIHPKSQLATIHGVKALEEAFRASGIPFGEGSEIRFLSSDHLLIRTPADDMDQLEIFLRFDPTVGERLSYWKANWSDELRWRLLPRPSPTDPVCRTLEPLNDFWDP